MSEHAIKTKSPFWVHLYLGDDACLALLLLAHHCVGFPSSSLSIGKNAYIVALKGMQQHLLPNIIVHTALRCKAGIFRLKRHEKGIESYPIIQVTFQKAAGLVLFYFFLVGRSPRKRQTAQFYTQLFPKAGPAGEEQ